MKKRVTELETENQKLLEEAKGSAAQIAQLSEKMALLEKQNEHLRLENTGSNSIISQMKQEHWSFVNRIWQDFINPNEDSPGPLSHHLKTLKFLSKPTADDKQKPFDAKNISVLQKSFIDLARSFLSKEATRTSSIPSFSTNHDAEMEIKDFVLPPKINNRKTTIPDSYRLTSNSSNLLSLTRTQPYSLGPTNLNKVEIDILRDGLKNLDVKLDSSSFGSTQGSVLSTQEDISGKRNSNYLKLNSIQPLLESEEYQAGSFSPESPDMQRVMGLDSSQIKAQLQNMSNIGGSTRSSLISTKKIFNQTFNPQGLFENLLILGVKKEELLARVKVRKDKLKTGNTIPFKPYVVYNFAENAGLEENVVLAGIEKFITPLQTNITCVEDKVKRSQIFDEVVNKQQRRYKKRYICPFQPHRVDIQISDWAEYVDGLNPQNKLYSLCIKKGDYLILDSVSDKKSFFYFDTIYCLLTYYPIPDLNFNLLASVLDMITTKRQKLYSIAKTNKSSDFETLHTIFSNQISSYLQQVLNLGTPSPTKTIPCHFNNDKSLQKNVPEYKFPQQTNAYLSLPHGEHSKPLALSAWRTSILYLVLFCLRSLLHFLPKISLFLHLQSTLYLVSFFQLNMSAW